MRRLLIGLFLLQMGSTPLWAGVYNLMEGEPYVPPDQFRARVLQIKSAAINKPATRDSYKARIEHQVAMLRENTREGGMSTLDRVNLSACYLRLGKVNEAHSLLLEGDREHFLIQSHLAATYFMMQQYDRAVAHQEAVLALWPSVFVGWSEEQLYHYRTCERYLLTLYRSRFSEDRRGMKTDLELDPLFPGFRFVGPDGTYRPGELAWKMRDVIPPNALFILLQINIWFPSDPRLYWFLGEALNANGQIDQAAGILDELVDNGMSRIFRDLHVHRRVLRSGRDAFRQLVVDPKIQGELATATFMIPPCSPHAGPAGLVAMLVTKSAVAPAIVEFRKPKVPLPPDMNGTSTPAQPAATLNLQHIAVSFGFGFLAALLMALQWNEFRRRKRPAVGG